MNDQNDLTPKFGMNVLKKIMTTIRKESKELTDAVMGSYGTVKIEQDFSSAQFKLNEAKQALTKMMRKQRQSSRIFDIIIDKITQQEGLIEEDLSNGDQAEAMKHALEVVDLEINKDIQIKVITSLTAHVNYLQRQLEQSERELKEFSRQLTMLKTTEKVQKATETILGNINGADADLLSAKKTLDRIREEQNNKGDVDGIQTQLKKSLTQIDSKANATTQVILVDSKNKAQAVIKRIQDKR